MPIVPMPAAARYWISGAPRPPAPIDEDASRLQLQLSRPADVAQHEVAGVAVDFVGREGHGGDLIRIARGHQPSA